MTPTPTLLAAGLWLLTTAPQVPPPVVDAGRAADLRARRDSALGRERSRLSALADRLRGEGRAAEAGEVAPGPAGASTPDGSSRFLALPEVVPAPPKGLASIEVGRAGGDPGWPAEREAIRSEAANALFELAGLAARPPSPSFALADECLRGVVARRPDHAEARRLLGYVPREGGWATPFAAEKLAQGWVSDPTYGWVPGDWVPHLRRGELPSRDPGRWLPAAEANALRRDWARRWEITTEHFRISTNAPLDDVIAFGRKLELLHGLFFSLMADVVDPDRLPLAQRFRKPDLKAASPGSKRSYQVDFFATREEYARHLAPIQGQGAKLSLGTYVPRKESREFGGVSFFFDDAGGQLDVASTLFHEASHQLLFESAGADNYTRNAGNFWVFEGLGTYFETLQVEPDGHLRVGGMVGPRIAQARRRLLGGEFLPIEHLASLNAPEFRGERGGGDIHLHYAESMALAVYLMQADGGRHREGFLDYVLDAYKGRLRGAQGRSLEDRIGIRYPELNRGFLDYLTAKSAP